MHLTAQICAVCYFSGSISFRLVSMPSVIKHAEIKPLDVSDKTIINEVKKRLQEKLMKGLLINSKYGVCTYDGQR